MNKKTVKNGLGFCLLFILSFLFFGVKVQALPPDVNQYFENANLYFDSVSIIFKADTVADIDSIELELYYLNYGLKNQKDAKKGSFKWIDSLITDLLLHQDYPGLPEDVDSFFREANIYFDSVIYIDSATVGLNARTDSFFKAANEWFDSSINLHPYEPYPPELETLMIEMKLHYLKYALKDQKHAKKLAFEETEAKLDTLLGWPFEGLPKEVEDYFDSSDVYFDLINLIHETPGMSDIEKIMWKLHYFKHALIWQKEAKHLMFLDLEYKLDSLIHQDFPGTLPPYIEDLFKCANDSFMAVNDYFDPGPIEPEIRIGMIEQMLYYLTKGLVCQKEAMYYMYWELMYKIFEFSGSPIMEPPFELEDAYLRADSFFAEIDSIHYQSPYPPIQTLEWKVFYLASGLKWEKEFKWLMFKEIKEELFEFDKVELKLHYLGKASKYQKEAKEAMFLELNTKLDTLIERKYGVPPEGLPPDLEDFFDSANTYFGLVDSIHQTLDTTELAKIETKLYYMYNGVGWQKEAWRVLFEVLETKLDSLLGWTSVGLPDTVDSFFRCVDSILHLFLETHNDTLMSELEKIETKLYYLSQALKCEKDAKWNMFDTLEYKIDSLSTGVEEIGEKETVPDKFILLQNYPNPFNPKTNIEFILKEPSWVTVEIYNLLGQRIKVVADRKFGVGSHSIYWDGKDEKGKEVSSGIYFYRVKTKDSVKTKKMVLVK